MVLTVVAFLIVLAILVFVHESGHYLAARHVGVRVQQFSIGFPPRAFGRTIGETEYRISWIPLGGYVKLLGQNIDDENPRDPRNYASKSIPQRFYILVAGPIANLVLALALMPLVYLLGVETPAYRMGPADIISTQPGTVAEAAGFAAGDRILAVGGAETPSWNDVFREATRQSVVADETEMLVRRGAATVALVLPTAVFNSDQPVGWRPLIAPIAGQVNPTSPAQAAGIVPGDRVRSVNGVPIARWDQIPEEIQRHGGAPVALELERAGQRVHLEVAPEFHEDAQRWIIGISPGVSKQRHGPVDAVALGSKRLWEITESTFLFLGRLVTGNGSMDALGGPVKIGIVVGDAARSGAPNLIFLMAVISLQLGVFNLLPIPALDGGHIFLLGMELVKGSPLSARLRERAQLIGFSLLLLLILIVTYNDIYQIVT